MYESCTYMSNSGSHSQKIQGNKFSNEVHVHATVQVHGVFWLIWFIHETQQNVSKIRVVSLQDEKVKRLFVGSGNRGSKVESSFWIGNENKGSFHRQREEINSYDTIIEEREKWLIKNNRTCWFCASTSNARSCKDITWYVKAQPATRLHPTQLCGFACHQGWALPGVSRFAFHEPPIISRLIFSLCNHCVAKCAGATKLPVWLDPDLVRTEHTSPVSSVGRAWDS